MPCLAILCTLSARKLTVSELREDARLFKNLNDDSNHTFNLPIELCDFLTESHVRIQ